MDKYKVVIKYSQDGSHDEEIISDLYDILIKGIIKIGKANNSLEEDNKE